MTLTLSLDPGPGPIAGVLATDSERVEFTGWIELAALIEAQRGEGPLRPAAAGFTESDSSPAAPPKAPPAS